mmetsp:Transcript_4564/g.9495  ORF Transcript_4564/g.9495 Transcript_4564/m.9495 type:complete len:93 (+) Transcript_4564:354-632(+)
MRYDRMGIGRVRPEEDEDGPGGDDGDRGKDGAGGGGFGPGEDVSRVSFEGGGAVSVPIFQVPSFSIGRVLANQMAGSRQFRHGQGLDFLHVD